MQARKAALDQIVSSLEALRQMDKEPEIQVVTDAPMEITSGEGAGEEEGQQREDRENDRRDREREREARDREEDGEDGEENEVVEPTLNPAAKPFRPRTAFDRLRDAEGGSSVPPSVPPSSPVPQKPEDGEEGEEHEDIEMGEVSEAPSQPAASVNGRAKKRLKEDLEEGEASDGSSALTELPEV